MVAGGRRIDKWVVDADIEACFDEIDHVALMGRVRQRGGFQVLVRSMGSVDVVG